MAIFDNLGGYDIAASIASGDLREEIDLKADIDGYYAQLTAGAADNLTGRGDATTAEFLYRTAGGTADIETGQAVAKSVKGNTLVWNQLAPSIEGASWRAAQNTTASRDGGKITATVTAAGYGYRVGITNVTNTVKGVKGHKYLVSYYVLCDKAANFGCDALNGGSKVLSACTAGVRSRIAGIFDYPTSEELVPSVNIYLCPMTSMSVGDTFTIDSPQLFDLTQMFGADNEPSTVAEFEALFPRPYYAYDAGSLLSVNMEGIETVGFNQWDEQWEVGGYSVSNGTTWETTDRIRSKAESYIPVFPSTEYSVTRPSGAAVTLCYYDADKTFISGITLSEQTFTTPANARYLRFATYPNYGTTYNHDICINLSWSGRRNGEYEPFWKSQRLIDVASYFPDGMRSAGSVRDELTSTEAITRVVPFTIEVGTTFASGDDGTFYASLDYNATLMPDNIGTSLAPMVSTLPYDTVARNQITAKDKTMSGHLAGDKYYIRVNDSSITTLEAFSQLMVGQTFLFGVTTPAVTPIDPPLNLSYRVDDFGTERIMVPAGENSAPPTIVAAQGYTAESLRDAALSAIAPVENGLASANYGVGAYLVHGGQLCKVTTAIATGESISIGTNVTATTVMAEVLTLVQ